MGLPNQVEARAIDVKPSPNPDGTRQYVVLWSNGIIVTGNGAAAPQSHSLATDSTFGASWTVERWTPFGGPGFIGRDIKITNWSTMGGYVLDGWGRLWTLGDAALPQLGSGSGGGNPFFGPGVGGTGQGDVARKFVLSSSPGNPTWPSGGYLIDQGGNVYSLQFSGGVRPMAVTPPVSATGFADIVRGFACDFSGNGTSTTPRFAMLDRYGTVFLYGNNYSTDTSTAADFAKFIRSIDHKGFDIMRAIAVRWNTGTGNTGTPETARGYVLDGFGGRTAMAIDHYGNLSAAAFPADAQPAVEQSSSHNPYTYGWDSFRDLYAWIEDTSQSYVTPTARFYLLDVSGKVWDISLAAAPTLTVSISSTFTSRPAINWTYTNQSVAGTQAAWSVRVYPDTVYTASGFTPGSTAGTVWTQDGFDTASSSQIRNLDLANNTAHRAYVRLTSASNQKSAWTPATWTVSYTPPTVGSVTINGSDTTGQVTINVASPGPGYNLDYQFTDDPPSAPGGRNWDFVAGGYNTTAPLLIDFEAPLRLARYYRARRNNTAPFQQGTYATSTPTAWTLNDPPGGLSSWFLWTLALYDASGTLLTAPVASPFYVRSWSAQIVEPTGVFFPPGARRGIVISAGAKGHGFECEAITHTKAEYDALEALLATGNTYRVQSRHGPQWYVRASARSADQIATPAAIYVHHWKITFIEVARPAPGS